MKILAALDFGESSIQALRQARALAHRIDGRLAACHVLPSRLGLAAYFVEPSAAESAELTGEEEKVRRELSEHVREKLGLELADVFVERGDTYAALVRRAEDWNADLVVVGSHGRTGIARVVLGSVAERVARYAHSSVLVARPAPSGVIVAATDLSPASLPAIAEGRAAAERTGARLLVVSAIEWGANWAPFGPLGALPAVPSPELRRQVEEALKSTVEQAMTAAGAVGEVRVLDGSPAAEIVHVANEVGAELVVVGTRGRTGLSRLALGSVAERVIRNASCSVLVVRAPGGGS